ncbi:MAG: LysR family transcriptional regulator [Rhodospirillales bacterium]|jgi:DNA-binding transcriptional LysR family regulator|nr:LysR family transcriptional regulator [Rhodospirillales bacterium]
MRQQKLETIIWLARLGSFRAVAERLNITQAAISQRVASMERELGAKLFERSTRGLKLTPEGATVLSYAERIVDLSAEMQIQVTNPSAYVGTIRMGAVETLVHVWLHRLLERIHETYPGVTIELTVDTSVVLREAVANGKLDLAMLLSPGDVPGLIKREICSYSLAWAASPRLGLAGKRLTVGELAKLPIITFPKRSAPYNMIKDLFRGRNLPPVRLNASGSLSTTIRLAVNGMGVSMLPPITIERELKEGLLHVFETDFSPPELHYTSIYPATPLNPLAEIISDMARSIATGA